MGWNVTNQEQTVTRTAAGGRTIDVVRVYFNTADGWTGSVDVPVNEYNASDGAIKIHQQIDAAVAKHDEVAALKSE